MRGGRDSVVATRGPDFLRERTPPGWQPLTSDGTEATPGSASAGGGSPPRLAAPQAASLTDGAWGHLSPGRRTSLQRRYHPSPSPPCATDPPPAEAEPGVERADPTRGLRRKRHDRGCTWLRDRNSGATVSGGFGCAAARGGTAAIHLTSMTAVPPRHDAGSRICPNAPLRGNPAAAPTRHNRRRPVVIPRPTGHTPPPVSPQERRAVCRRVPPAALRADWRGRLLLPVQVRGLGGSGPACRPGSVPPPERFGGGGDHPSATTVAGRLVRSTRMLGRAALERILSDLAPGGVCLAAPVARRTGGLLHHRFTLTGPRTGGLFSVALIPRVAPGGCWPPPCPVEPGPSSTRHRSGEPRPPGRPTREGV